jgi:hypothetical protein
MDISEIGRPSCDLPHVGPAILDVFGIDVMAAVERGRWTDPHEFVRDLVGGHAELERDELDLSQLSNPQLDEIAVAIWRAIKLNFGNKDHSFSGVQGSAELLSAYQREARLSSERMRKMLESHLPTIQPAIFQYEKTLTAISSNSMADPLGHPSAYDRLVKSLGMMRSFDLNSTTMSTSHDYIKNFNATLAATQALTSGDSYVNSITMSASHDSIKNLNATLAATHALTFDDSYVNSIMMSASHDSIKNFNATLAATQALTSGDSYVNSITMSASHDSIKNLNATLAATHALTFDDSYVNSIMMSASHDSIKNLNATLAATQALTSGDSYVNSIMMSASHDSIKNLNATLAATQALTSGDSYVNSITMSASHDSIKNLNATLAATHALTFDDSYVNSIMMSASHDSIKNLNATLASTQALTFGDRYLDAMVGLGTVSESFRSTELAAKAIANSMNVAALSSALIAPESVAFVGLSNEAITSGLQYTGFNFAAQAAVSGLAAHSVAAEVLARYQYTLAGLSPVFKENVEIVQSLDGETLSPADLEAIIERVSEQVVNAHADSGTWFHPQNFYMLVTLVIMVITLWIQSNAPTSDQFDVLLGRQNELVELQQADLERGEARYRNDRRLAGRYHLREAPDAESASVTILNTDQIVTVRRTQGDWVSVLVIPYANEETIEGWVHRSGLAPLGR